VLVDAKDLGHGTPSPSRKSEIRTAVPPVYNTSTDAWLVTSYRDCSQVVGTVKQFDSGPSAAAITEVASRWKRSIRRGITRCAACGRTTFERAALECEERRTKPDDNVISRMFVSDFGRTGIAET
jgi:hypothetical protein